MSWIVPRPAKNGSMINTPIRTTPAIAAMRDAGVFVVTEYAISHSPSGKGHAAGQAIQAEKRRALLEFAIQD